MSLTPPTTKAGTTTTTPHHHQVHVTLSQEEYLAGDVVQARIVFSGPHDQVVDWAAVQLQGRVWHDTHVVASAAAFATMGSPKAPPSVSPSPSGLKENRASFTYLAQKHAMPDLTQLLGGNGSVPMFSCKPHVLVGELQLDEEKEYVFEARLPSVLPPTFHGVAARYVYLFSLGVKLRSLTEPKVLHVPIYVSGTPSLCGDAARLGPIPWNSPMNGVRGHIPSQSSPPPPPRASSLSPSPSPPPAPPHLHPHGEDDDLPSITPWAGLDVNVFPNSQQQQPIVAKSCSAKDFSGPMINVLAPTNNGHLAAEDDKVSVASDSDPEPSNALTETLVNVSYEVMNVVLQNGQKCARCFVTPSRLYPGEPVSVRLDFLVPDTFSTVEACIIVEERVVAPPPLLSVFQPLVRRRGSAGGGGGGGPWTRVVSKVVRDVSCCSSIGLTLSTHSIPPNFSTDLVVVKTWLKLDFAQRKVYTTTNHHDDNTISEITSSMRVPLIVLPSVPERGLGNADWFVPGNKESTGQSPILSSTPKKKLVF